VTGRASAGADSRGPAVVGHDSAPAASRRPPASESSLATGTALGKISLPADEKALASYLDKIGADDWTLGVLHPVMRCSTGRGYDRAVTEVRECAQCGLPFTPKREHARFCSARCRMAWNREHAGVAAAPAVAIDWSVTAMTEATGRLAVADAWDLPRLAAAVGETVWWITLVDATLVRYHPHDYENALASKAVRRRKTEEALEGLRYVRNQLGKSVDPTEFVRPVARDDGGTEWTWCPQPEPGLGELTPRARRWELSRYRAYQARLAERDLVRTFNRCTEFLIQAADLAAGRVVPG